MNRIQSYRKKLIGATVGTTLALTLGGSTYAGEYNPNAPVSYPVLEVVDPGPHSLAENPVWNQATQCLLYANIHGATLYQYCPSTGQITAPLVGTLPFGISVNQNGSLIVGSFNGVHYVKNVNGSLVAQPLLLEDTNNPFSTSNPNPIWVNEQAVANGGIYFGDVTYFGGDNFGPGNLYYMGPDGVAKQVVKPTANFPLALPNGLGVSQDQKTLYFAVSGDRKIYSFNINKNTGELTSRKIFATLERQYGMYDGLTVNSAGEVLVAVWYGGKILRYDSQGNHIETIMLTTNGTASGSQVILQPSNLTYGGSDLKDLYITTASGPFPGEILPPVGFDYNNLQSPDGNVPATPILGGAVYRLRMNTAGLAEDAAQIPAP